jgi:hypothetical protein
MKLLFGKLNWPYIGLMRYFWDLQLHIHLLHYHQGCTKWQIWCEFFYVGRNPMWTSVVCNYLTIHFLFHRHQWIWIHLNLLYVHIRPCLSGYSPVSHSGGLGSIPVQVIWDLWWTKWHYGRFPPSTSVSPANYHSTKCSILIYHPGLEQ